MQASRSAPRCGSLVALALTRRLRLIAVVDQDVNAFLSLATGSGPLSRLYVVLLLNQLATLFLEDIVAKSVKGRNLSRR